MAFFEIKNVKFPALIKTNDEFKITGDVHLFGIPFLGLLWIDATITFPPKTVAGIPVPEPLGVPTATAVALAFWGHFAFDFTPPTGFDREGDYSLDLNAYLGPETQVHEVVPSKNVSFPPFPPIASIPTAKFTISGSGSALDIISKTSVSYSTPKIGQPVVATITITNTGNYAVTPQFRCDIRNDNQHASTPQEGSFVNTGTLGVGESKEVDVSSIAVPSDWAGGDSLTAQVVLNGLDGAWDTKSGLIILGNQGILDLTVSPSEATFMIGGVIFQPGQHPLAPGYYAWSCMDSPWITQTGGFTITAGQTYPLHISLVKKNQVLTVSFTVVQNAFVSYSYSGFPANTQLILSVVGQNNAAFDHVLTDLTGAGSSSFYAVIVPGNYTLQLTDNAGNAATAPFAVTGYAPKITLASASVQVGAVDLYTILGFPPNASLTLAATDSNGNITQIGTASTGGDGSGSAGFTANLATGIYTLRLMDNAGHVATTTVTVIPASTPTVVNNFNVIITGYGADISYWECSYYDPVTGQFVPAEVNGSQNIPIASSPVFNNIHPKNGNQTGYLAIFLWNGTAFGNQINTTALVPVDNGQCMYNVATRSFVYGDNPYG